MAYFAQFLRPSSSKELAVDPVAEFDKSWTVVKTTLESPDERQLARGIRHTDVIHHLNGMVDALIKESSTLDQEATGGCLEYLLKNDILGSLVRLSENDRPFGVQSEVLRMIIRLVSALDEQFLVHSAVHKAVIRLLRVCVGDEIQEPLDGSRPMGAASTATQIHPSEYEEDLVDLLCTLCTRIRTYPDLLLIFLHDKNWYTPPTNMINYRDEEEEEEEAEAVESTSGSNPMRAISPTPSSASTITSAPSAATRKKTDYEFLIFNYLLRFVHREGKIGDLARGGILSLIDVAMTAGEAGEHVTADASTAVDPVADAALALAEYILDGDFSDVLCAGLGAVYSQLPTKLEVRHEVDHSANGMVLGGISDEERTDRKVQDLLRAERSGIVFSTDPMFRARLDHFLQLLEFVQDVLLRICGRMDDPLRKNFTPSALVGAAVTQAVMETFRTTFLKNVLYPSILESSEQDGSSVAVMTYIDEMLRALTEASLSDLVITFLMSEDDDDETKKGRRLHQQIRERVLDGRKLKTRTSKHNRRKSSAMILLEAARNPQDDPNYFSSLGRFTLKDLLISNLRSTAHPASEAALRLLQSLFKEHCHLTVDGLLTVRRDERATAFGSSAGPSKVLKVLEGKIPPPNFEPDDSDEEDFIYPGAEIAIERDNNMKSSSYDKILSTIVEPDTTFADHIEEVELYLGLVNRVTSPSRKGSNNLFDSFSSSSSLFIGADSTSSFPPEAGFSTGFENYVSDAVVSIQSQSCFLPYDDSSILSMPRHRLLPSDPLLGALLQSLRLFFSHTPQHNLALTGVLAAICSCPHRSVEGFLTMTADTDDGTGLGDWGSEATRKKTGIWSSSLSRSLARYKLDDDDDDDSFELDDETRTTDYKISQLLLSGIKPSAKKKKSDGSHLPVLYMIFSGLVAQLGKYQRQIEDFDRYLEERRQGLLFEENINDALHLHFELKRDSDILTGRRGSADANMVTNSPQKTNAPHNTPVPNTKPKIKGPLASFTAYLTPTKTSSKSKSTSATSSAKSSPPKDQVTPQRRGSFPATASDLPASTSSRTPGNPFSPHYAQTNAISVEPYVAPPPSAGLWAPQKQTAATMDFSSSLSSSFGGGFLSSVREEVDVFSNNSVQPADMDLELRAAAQVTLSQLLDNVVILEESLKELAAIIQVRRSLGIDGLRII